MSENLRAVEDEPDELRIDPEFSAIVPPLAADERDGLEAAILSWGVREPLVTWRGLLVDGHHRHGICQRHGLGYQTVELAVETRDDVKRWIIRNQLARRNLSESQRAMCAARLAAMEQGRPEKTGKSAGLSQAAAGALFNVSERSVRNARAILKSGAPELVAAVERGEVAVSAAAIQAKRTAKAAEREDQRRKNAALVAAAPDVRTIEGRFTTIVADPPWDFSDAGDNEPFGRARPTYKAMPLVELRKYPVASLAADDAHLYLWVTNRSVPLAFGLVEAWGFRYVTLLTWCKPSFGMGNYFRGSTEQILFCVRGSLPLKVRDVGTWFAAPRGARGHSAKPEEFYRLVERCSPGPYLELFSRSERKGWVTHGAEL
jgi:N6-adenosine-specific RNA methylase IME4